MSLRFYCHFLIFGLGYEKLLNFTVSLSEGNAGFAPPPSACKVMFRVTE